MRRLLRWIIVLGVLAALGWVAVKIPIGSRTAVGHANVWWKRQKFFARDPATPPVKAKSAKPAVVKASAEPAPVEKEATAKRVALLEAAAKQASEPPRTAAKTRIDERHSASNKKALDELVTSHVSRD